jgi:hypothetical protein
MDFDCYFNFCEQNGTLVEEDQDIIIPVAQIDIMGTVLASEIVPTFLLSHEEVPVPLQIPLAEWSQFTAAVAEHSGKLLHHRSNQLQGVYFALLAVFLVLLTVIKTKVSSVFWCPALLSLCLVCLVGFVMAFNHLPTWHDEVLDENIMEVLEMQPFAKYGYSMDYVRQHRSEGLMGNIRVVRIFEKRAEDTYQQPVLEV